jgi:trehalose 6-phosphate phosphatase
VGDASETEAVSRGEHRLARLNIPAPRRDMALFLDFDGTLVDIAAAPESIFVPADLPQNLLTARERLGGALAIVSGRPLAALDRYLQSPDLVLVGEHGAISREPGRGPSLEASLWPSSWVPDLDSFAAAHPALIVEKKLSAVTIHFRLAPEQSDAARHLADKLTASHPDYAIFPAKMAWEVRHRDIGKAGAVAVLMKLPPFAGRIPVFIGDDLADEAAIAMVARMGGFGLHTSTDFAGKPALVRKWLKQFAALDAEPVA